jgi:hypothetical protein
MSKVEIVWVYGASAVGKAIFINSVLAGKGRSTQTNSRSFNLFYHCKNNPTA